MEIHSVDAMAIPVIRWNSSEWLNSPEFALCTEYSTAAPFSCKCTSWVGLGAVNCPLLGLEVTTCGSCGLLAVHVAICGGRRENFPKWVVYMRLLNLPNHTDSIRQSGIFWFSHRVYSRRRVTNTTHIGFTCSTFFSPLCMQWQMC